MREYVLSPLRQEQQAWQRRVWCYTKNFSPVKLITTFIAFNWFLPVVKCLCVIICDYTTSYFCNKYNQAWQPCIYSHNKHTLWYNVYCKEKVSPLCVFSNVLLDIIFYYCIDGFSFLCEVSYVLLYMCWSLQSSVTDVTSFPMWYGISTTFCPCLRFVSHLNYFMYC